MQTLPKAEPSKTDANIKLHICLCPRSRLISVVTFGNHPTDTTAQ